MTIAIFYATREGHTRRVAEYLAAGLRRRGISVDLFDVAEGWEGIDLTRYSVAIVAASVHLGRHEREIVQFVKTHRQWLDLIPSAFVSVSLSQAGAEDPARTEEMRARLTKGVHDVLQTFFRATKWVPPRVVPIAGALVYSKYNPLVRTVMKWIAKHEEGPTDTSRDYVLTDWRVLDRLVDEIAAGEEAGAYA